MFDKNGSGGSENVKNGCVEVTRLDKIRNVDTRGIIESRRRPG